MSYGERAELLNVDHAETTRQAGVLTKAAIALITQNPWTAFALNTAADGIISGGINLENVVKDAAFTYVSGGIQGSSATFGSQKWLTDTAVRAVKEGGIRTAVYGGSLKDNIAGAATQIAVNDATAFVHGKIGDVKEDANWGEGSFPGAVLKGAAGCISSDLNGGNCGRGAVLAAGAEFATGFVHDQTGGDTYATAEAMLRYGNPVLAALTSGGDVNQFGINQGIADSQLKNNYLFHAEAVRRQELINKIDNNDCGHNGCADEQQEVGELTLLDDQRNEALIQACRNNNYGTACFNERMTLKAAAQSYLSAGFDPANYLKDIEAPNSSHLRGDFREVLELYGTASEQAMAEAGRAALSEIPFDITTGIIDLGAIGLAATNGTPEEQALARAQLRLLADDLHAFVSDPVGKIEADIKANLDRADALESQGKVFEAEKLRSKTMLNLQLSVTGAGGAAAGLAKGGLKAVAKVGDLSDLDGLFDFGKTDINPLEIRQAVEATKGGTVDTYFGQQRKFWSEEPVQFNGNKVYQRNDLIDPNRIDPETGLNNKQLMEQGYAPYGSDGKKINLHHMTQTQSGPIAEVTQSFHQKNYKSIHVNTPDIPSGINRSQFDTWRRQYWTSRANDFEVPE